MDLLLTPTILPAILAIAATNQLEAIPEPTTSISTPSLEIQQAESTITQIPVTCPPGQFASAFADVDPTDWAYEAVNRMASAPIECFDLSE